MRLRHLLSVLGLAAALPVVAAAQAPPPDQPDLTLDPAARKAVVDTLAERLERLYVFPDKAKETAKALRKRLASKEYDRITSAKEFRDSLTSHMQAVTRDLHLRVNYRHEAIPPMREDGPVSPVYPTVPHGPWSLYASDSPVCGVSRHLRVKSAASYRP